MVWLLQITVSKTTASMKMLDCWSSLFGCDNTFHTIGYKILLQISWISHLFPTTTGGGGSCSSKSSWYQPLFPSFPSRHPLFPWSSTSPHPRLHILRKTTGNSCGTFWWGHTLELATGVEPCFPVFSLVLFSLSLPHTILGLNGPCIFFLIPTNMTVPIIFCILWGYWC